ATGDSITAAASTLAGGASPTLGLYDANGNLLAAGVTTATNVQAAIPAYTAATAGTYYVKVTGSSIDYSLLLTDNGVFDLEANGSVATAQNTGTSKTTFGSVGAGQPGPIKLGLIQDQLAWNSSSDTTVATGLGYTVTTIASSTLSTANLSQFDVLV